VEPADQTLIIDGTTPATASYRATGVFSDQHREDITARVAFHLADVGLGTFNGAALATQTERGGKTLVLADAGAISGSTGLTLVLRKRASDPGSSGLPPDPGSRFQGSVDAGRAVELVYPNDGVVVPPNLGKLEFHFRTPPANSLFELAFANAITDVKIYLRCTPLGGGCFYLPETRVWRWIAETNRGGSPLAVSLRGTDDAGSATGVSNGLTMAFTKDDVQGGIYYWTTSGTSAIMRFDFASQ